MEIYIDIMSGILVNIALTIDKQIVHPFFADRMHECGGTAFEVLEFLMSHSFKLRPF